LCFVRAVFCNAIITFSAYSTYPASSDSFNVPRKLIAGVGLRDQLSASFLNQADNGAAGVALAWLVLAIFVLHGFVGLFLQWRLWRTPPRK
jgi:hypothetical protein